MRFFNSIAVIILQQPAEAFIAPHAAALSFFRNCCNDLYSSKPPAEQNEVQTKVTFQSPKFRVYIEDTDAYGVLYNSNYVRAFERALLQYAPLSASDETSRKWILSAIHNQKFRSSPALGEEYIIRGKLVHANTWEIEMITENESSDVVHNSALVEVTPGMKLSPANELTLKQSGKVDEKRYIPYHDEFDHYNFDQTTSRHNYYIPIRNAMNFFERSRSDFLGGPDALRKMQVEDDLIWVVTGVENGKLFDHDSAQTRDMDDISVNEYRPEDEMQKMANEETAVFEVSPGKEVIVETTFDVKRKGMILDCHHTLWMEGGSQRKLLAQATCVIVALKGSTRRPTSNLPQWVLDKFAE
jgi:acyl-CoA thioesterase FadM